MAEDLELESAVVTARRGLHAVAESLLAGPQWRTSGTIRLAVTGGGFATTRSPAPGLTRLAVAHRTLTAEPGGLVLPLAGSIDDLAAALGVEPGAPVGVYPDSSAGVLGPLDLPTAGVDVVLNALILGDQALRALTAAVSAQASGPTGTPAENPGENPLPAVEPVLWPEHFDLGLSLDEVNFGISPGDAGHPMPYAYVGPWAARRGEFWNEPFGAARRLADLGDVTAVTGFLLEGRARAAADPRL